MRRTAVALVLLALVAPAGLLLAAGGAREDISEKAEEKSPAAMAAEHYNSGLASRDRAWSIEEKMEGAELSDAKREKLEGKIHGAYEDALESFREAVESDPKMHRAWGSMGYAYRQLGDYEAALDAYDRALSLRSDYGEAIEYLGEAYLGLGRIGDAKETYGRLVSVDEKLSQELLAAMGAWIAQRRTDPGGIKIGELDAFERWADERRSGEPLESSLRKRRSW